MQYTPDQLVALVEEARGHVHEVMMGALWDEARYKRCQDFMERTNIVEYTTEGGTVFKIGLGCTTEEEALKMLKETRAKLAALKDPRGIVEVQPMPRNPSLDVPLSKRLAADVSDVLGRAFSQDEKITPKRPRGRPRKNPTEPIPEGLSIDQEVAFMRQHGVIGSRDALRDTVKARRRLQAG